MVDFTSNKTGPEVDGATGDMIALVGAGLSKNLKVIGTLDVSSDILHASFSATGASIGIQITTGIVRISQDLTTVKDHITFTNPNGQVGSITTNGNATAFNVSSDPRLKSEFTAFDPAKAWSKFDAILANSGTFHFLSDPDDERWGLNAHGIIDAGLDIGTEGAGPRNLNIGDEYKAAVMDETGEHEKEPALFVTPAGVDQSKITPYLVAVIADLRDRIEALEAQ